MRVVDNEYVEDVHGCDADLEVVVIGIIQHSFYQNFGYL